MVDGGPLDRSLSLLEPEEDMIIDYDHDELGYCPNFTVHPPHQTSSDMNPEGHITNRYDTRYGCRNDSEDKGTLSNEGDYHNPENMKPGSRPARLRFSRSNPSGSTF